MYEFKNWQPWDLSTLDAALNTDFGSDKAPHTVNTAASLATMINVKQVSQLMIRGFGADTDNDDARIQIVGWLENGPGQILLRADLQLGSDQFNEDILTSAEAGNPFGGENALFEVDTYSILINNCRAYVETAGANTTGFIVMNAMQCRYLELQVDLSAGAGTAGTKMGLIWRPLS